MKHAIMVSVVALLALAACAKKDESAASATGSPASATAPAATMARETTPPSRKAGLWEQTVQSDKMTQTTSMCLDDAFSKKMTVWGQDSGKQACEKSVVAPRLGGGWTFSSVCDMGPSGKISSEGVAIGDFASHIVVDITSSTTGSSMPQANGEHKMRMEATWKGPCPAGMRAGDVTLPGGMTINMADAMDSAGKPSATPARPTAEQIAAMRRMIEAQKH